MIKMTEKQVNEAINNILAVAKKHWPDPPNKIAIKDIMNYIHRNK